MNNILKILTAAVMVITPIKTVKEEEPGEDPETIITWIYEPEEATEEPESVIYTPTETISATATEVPQETPETGTEATETPTPTETPTATEAPQETPKTGTEATKTPTPTETPTATEAPQETPETGEKEEEKEKEPETEEETLKAILQEVKAINNGGGAVKAPAGYSTDYFGIDRKKTIYIYTINEWHHEYDYDTSAWIDEIVPWYFASNSANIAFDRTYASYETESLPTFINIYTANNKQQIISMYQDTASAKSYAYGSIPAGWGNSQACRAGNYNKECRGVIQTENGFRTEFAIARRPTETGVDGELTGAFAVYEVIGGNLETGPDELRQKRAMTIYPASLEIIETVDPVPAYVEPTLNDILFYIGVIIILLTIIIFKRGRRH